MAILRKVPVWYIKLHGLWDHYCEAKDLNKDVPDDQYVDMTSSEAKLIGLV
jgi:hypothetical protein